MINAIIHMNLLKLAHCLRNKELYDISEISLNNLNGCWTDFDSVQIKLSE